MVVRARPFVPGLAADRRRRRTEREHVDQHRLVVAAPVVFEEALLRRPAEADRGRARLCPAPIDAAIDLVGQPADFGFLRLRPVEVRLAEQHAREQQRRVHGRKLAVLEALPRLHVEEMIEKPFVSGHPVWCVPWGAFQRKRSVVSTRLRASLRVT